MVSKDNWPDPSVGRETGRQELKPELIKRSVEVWDCGIDSHCHLKQRYAYNCIESRLVSHATIEKRNQINILMGVAYKLRLDGLKFKLIGEAINRTPTTARVYYCRQRRQIEHQVSKMQKDSR